ncbi:MAG TPA: aminoacyl-tRNA hydrolase [Planctomycetota bacterium]|nr:aminoacyl-tRNA hydrolase [Planctomycetota bacterium]
MGWHRIVVGIGNPGTEYEATRHNVGFMVLDLLASRLGLAFTRLERHADDGSRIFSGKVKAKVCEGRRKGRSFLLVKPQTYVNLSGEVVAPLLRHAGGQPLLFVIVDDLNLPLGRIRIRPSGSAGGHNGLKSIEQMLGSDAYPRLRLGIGQPVPRPEEGVPSHAKPSAAKDGSEGLRSAAWPDFVLAPFLPEEREVLGRVLGRAADCVEAWLDGKDLQTLMGTYNSPESGSRPGE